VSTDITDRQHDDQVLWQELQAFCRELAITHKSDRRLSHISRA